MSAAVIGRCRRSPKPVRSRTGTAPDSVVHAFLLGLATGPDLDPAGRDRVIDHLDNGHRTAVEIAERVGCTERTVNRRRTARVREQLADGRLTAGDPWPFQHPDAFVIRSCGHRMLVPTWSTGYRSCHRCLVADLVQELQNETEVTE